MSSLSMANAGRAASAQATVVPDETAAALVGATALQPLDAGPPDKTVYGTPTPTPEYEIQLVGKVPLGLTAAGFVL